MPRFAASLGALGCIASASAFLGGQLAPRRAFAPRMSASVAGTSQDVEGLEAGMPFSLLGDAGISVSAAALGTADWGHGRLATDAAVAEMLEVALKFGVNFVDTSELWPHPWDPAEAGKGQAMLGRWLAANADKRDGLVIGASVAGYSDRVDYLPRLGDAGGTRLSAAQLTAAVDDALERLQTDRIELLTLQWPERYVPLWGSEDPAYSQEDRPDATPIAEQLAALDGLIKAGKVKAYALGHETPYGLAQWAAASAAGAGPMPAAVVASYSLLTRSAFDHSGMAEACAGYGVPLIATSPLAGGVLTGKYAEAADLADGSLPDPEAADTAALAADDDSRLRKYQGFMARYDHPRSRAAVQAYAATAAKYGLTVAQLALGFCYTRPAVASTVVGATSALQLEKNLFALNCPVNADLEGDLYENLCDHRDPSRGVAEV